MSFLSNIACTKTKHYHKYTVMLAFVIALVIVLGGCSTKQPPPQDNILITPAPVAKIGFTIQAGAFARQANAVRLESRLHDQGLDDAFYFIEKGMYKVRFGNYSSYSQALSAAKLLRERGVVADYYIVRPGSFTVNRVPPETVGQQLVNTAEGFLGIPYKWGGTSVQTGFDCSGLSMVVYRLNGVNLPRTSRMQYRAGKQVSARNLVAGDLVFFSTDLSGKVNHVGIYKGNNRFIHAPRKGKKIKVAKLNSTYFRKRYLGARRYI